MISAIFLAAGKSSRFLGENKLLKIYKKKELFLHSLENLQKSIVKKIIFVCGKDSNIIKKKIKKSSGSIKLVKAKNDCLYLH